MVLHWIEKTVESMGTRSADCSADSSAASSGRLMVVPKAVRMVRETAEPWVVYWAESWAARKVAQWVGSKGPTMAVWWVASWVDTWDR
jgi:hypothetical protein